MRTLLTALLVLTFTSGCSLRKLAVNQIGNALAAGGTVYSSDDDPELIGQALPFSLKLIESVLAESPKHQPLLITASRGFTQYAYGWVEPSGESDDDRDLARLRAKRLYLRARDYGLRAMEVSIDDFGERLAADPRQAVKLAGKRDVPALYWTAAAWGLAISSGKDDLDLLADLALVEALIERAAELDPGFDEGAIDTFLISFEASRSAVSKDAAARAREHFRLAVERSAGTSASPFVTAAEALAIPDQNGVEFKDLIARALAIDPNARPEMRLQNILAQRRAAWLKSHYDDFFIESVSGGTQ